MRIRLIIALAVTAAALVGPAGVAQAALTVSNTNDSGAGSLRQTVAEASPGETINVPAGTYALTSGPLKLTKAVTLAGAGITDTIIRSGGSFRVLEGVGPFDATLRDLTIRDGKVVTATTYGAAIYSLEANFTLQRVAVTANVADANGTAGNPGGTIQGGILFVVGETFKLLESRVEGNVVTSAGGSGKNGGIVQGGLTLIMANTTISNSTISGNLIDVRGGQGPSTAAQSGGIIQGGVLFTNQTEPPSPTAISNSTVAGNVLDASAGPGGTGGVIQAGGGLLLANKAPAEISNVTVASNSIRSNGATDATDGVIQGGVMLAVGTTTAPLKILDSTIAGNTVESTNPETSGALGLAGNVATGGTIVANKGDIPGSENCTINVVDTEVVSLGFNIESTDQCKFKSPGDRVNTAPLLGPLQLNGSSTPTMLPQLGSPAIDQGRTFGLTTDQRGLPRPIDLPAFPNSAAAGADGSDIGAVEVQAASGLTLGKFTKNKKKGTATIVALLPQPAAGTLTLSGKGLRTQSVAVTGATEQTLNVLAATKKVRKALRKKGKRKIQISVTYAPPAGPATTQIRKAKLVKKLKKKRKKHTKPAKSTK